MLDHEVAIESSAPRRAALCSCCCGFAVTRTQPTTERYHVLQGTAALRRIVVGTVQGKSGTWDPLVALARTACRVSGAGLGQALRPHGAQAGQRVAEYRVAVRIGLQAEQ